MHYRWRLNSIVAGLYADAVIAYPTEGVWGLGCLPDSEQAVARILSLKQRSVRQGLILVAADVEQFAPLLASLTADQQAQLEQYWPGHVTILVPDPANHVPAWVKGEHNTVALRVSTHPVVRDLCQAAASPIVSTSANVHGCPAITSEIKARAAFGKGVDDYINGQVDDTAGASAIIDLQSGRRLR